MPVITSDGGGAAAEFSVAENSTTVTTVTATDADSDPVTFSITGGADQAKFSIDATSGALAFAAAPDFNSPGDSDTDNRYVVEVTAQDGLGGSDVQTITVSVLSDIDRDGAPDGTDPDMDGDGRLNSSEDPVPGARGVQGDGNGDGTPDREQSNVVSLPTVGTGTTDQKWGTLAVAEGLTLSNVSNSTASGLPRNAKMPVGQFDFTIEGGAVGGSVTVDLYVDKALNTNGYYKKVGSTWTNIGTVSTVGSKTQISFTLIDGGVYDADGLANGVIVDPGGAVVIAPLITSDGGDTAASVSVAEKSTVVTTVTATQPPATTTVSYQIAGGADAARFTVDTASGLLSFIDAPDFESPTDADANNSYIVDVTARDEFGSSDTQTLTVNVTDINDAPTGAVALTGTATQGQTLTADTGGLADADGLGSLSYVWKADGSVIAGATGSSYTLTQAEVGKVITVEVSYTDGEGSAEGPIASAATAAVTNANDHPVITSNGGGAAAELSVAENSMAVTTVTATDADSDPVTFSITGGADQAKFSIDAASGALVFAAAPNFEAPTDADSNNSYIVEVSARDEFGGSDTQMLLVSVTDVNEPPPDVDEPPVIDPSDPPPPDEWGQLPDDDGDGVPEVIEDFVPSLAPRDGSALVPGDGNGDGIADRLQTDVASIPFRHTAEITQNPQAPVTFVTLVAESAGGAPAGGSSITAARQLDAPAVGEGPGERPADLELPLGLISFSATVPEPEVPVSFSLYVSGDVPINGYWKPTADGWVNLASSEYGGQMVVDGDKIRLDFVIEDNGPFDDDPTPGVIGDPGGPGYMQSVPGPSDCPYDPFKPDADRDGMPDSVEAALGFDRAIRDNDVQGDDTLFVRQLYRDLLGREGEAEEVAYWVHSLEQGQSHAQVVSGFVASAECDAYAGAIVRLYHAVLGRTPDYCGFNYWVGRSLEGLTDEEMGTAFLQSAEFVGNNPSLSDEAFVDLLYQNVLGRAADAPGKAYWVDRMAQGESRGEVLYGFAQSGEYKAAMADEVAIDLLYLGLLDRAPDPAGWDYWHGQWGQFDDTAQFYGTAMSVAEYAERFMVETPPVSLVGVEAMGQG
nr:DUF4214 domain-containing protein [Thauera aromatica]